ncbi:MAG TPA: archease [Candidatus Limnocylindrales bacterium]|nr:archease [Candidatus Limnocylindrales bacterium]
MVQPGRDAGLPVPGYRLLPHTADLVLIAAGSSRESCLEQAIGGLVASFAETRPATRAAETVTCVLHPDSDADLLVQALEEVLYLADAQGAVPVTVSVRSRVHDEVTVEFGVVPLSQATTVGQAPKGISWHALSFTAVEGCWRCRVIIDV